MPHQNYPPGALFSHLIRLDHSSRVRPVSNFTIQKHETESTLLELLRVESNVLERASGLEKTVTCAFIKDDRKLKLF